MIRISEVLVVEGKYDKIKLSQLFDTLILTTDGFRIYKNKEKLQLLRRIAAERGVIVLTDSDSAGFRIRNYIRQCLGSVPVKHVYVPAVAGRERRERGGRGRAFRRRGAGRPHADGRRACTGGAGVSA